MKVPLRFILLALSILLPCTLALQCSSLKPEIPNVFCDCEYLEESNGWTLTCFNVHTMENLFILQYVVDSTIRFECGANETEYEPFLQKINHTKIQTFVIKSCPLPSISYGDVIPVDDGQSKLQEIRIENTKDDRPFSSELFEPTSEHLKALVLRSNRIEELPETMFENFTKLQYLSLSENLLKTLPEKIFYPLQQLTTLEITSNLLESLPESIFQYLFQLKKLYLYKNRLKDLPDNFFKSLPSLEVLDLADNQLMALQPDIFLGLSQLKHVRLRGNWLRIIPKELFSYSLNLQEIELSLNRFMEPLPETLLHGLSKLESFKADECNMSLIYQSFFQNCTNLTLIQLEYNALKTLPDNLFQNNSRLKELNLNFNFIEALPVNLFPNQKYLEKVSLYRNNITTIPNGFFKNARNIKILVLGSNNIQSVSQQVFRDLPSIESIDLSKNNLSYIKLDLNRDIKKIFLSYNNLTKMPSISWLHHLKLELLDLQHNKLSSLSIPVLYSRNPTINAAHNNIKTVSVRDVRLNEQAIANEFSTPHYEPYAETTVSLSSNPFTCDCSLYEFYDYLKHNNQAPRRSVRFLSAQDLKCQEPPVYQNQGILLLKPSQFICDISENCFPPCHCYIQAQDDSRIVNCSGHHLKELPKIVPYNTSILHFQGNSLSSLADFKKHQWSNLTQLYLDDNKISSLSNWSIPPSLQVLSLAGNRIRYFPDAVMNYSTTKAQFRMNLSRNPWVCNCSTMHFKKWLAEHYRFVEDANKILCAGRQMQNSSLVRVSVLTVPDDVMCPVDNWPYRAQLITIATVCAILALSLFVVSVLYYRNKQTVIAYIYIHMHPFFICFFNEEDFDEDKVFDAFVAYGHEDADVAHKLIDELEPHFQLCIHERNWIAGNQISWNIFNSVHNSRRTILVISKQFLDSMWFQVEFHTAYYQMLEDKIDRLIIIVKGELPPKETLDKELLYLLSTKTYLIWEERWFWEKLRYAMPHKKQQALQSEVLALKDKPDREKIKAVDTQIAILSANSGKTTDKVQEVVQNGTNRALSLVNKDTAVRK